MENKTALLLPGMKTDKIMLSNIIKMENYMVFRLYGIWMETKLLKKIIKTG